MNQFKTSDEARAAGYKNASPGRLDTYRGCHIVSCDVSGPNERGYAFAIKVDIPESISGTPYGDSPAERFGVSESIWLTEAKNKINDRGSFTLMYSAGSMEIALRDARSYIDRYLAARQTTQ